MKRLISLVFFVIAAFALAAAVYLAKERRFETSLERLAGANGLSLPDPIKNAVSSRVQVISSSKTFEAAQELAENFVSQLDTNVIENIVFKTSNLEFKEIISFYSQAGGGFLSPKDKELYLTSNLVNQVRRDLFSSYKLVFQKDDSLGFIDRFVKTLPRGFGSWKLKDDFLCAKADGLYHVLISFSLPKASVFDIKKLPNILNPILLSCDRLNNSSKDATLSISGVSLHTLETSSKCEREITLLSLFSLAFIVILALRVISSLKSILAILLNLAVSASVGFAAVCLFFDSIHLMALVFGTTLIGLAVDYSFHALLAIKGNEVIVKKNLIKSFLTTIVSLLPLAFSSLSALVQTAIFLTAGLFSSLIFSLTLLSCGVLRSEKVKTHNPPKWMIKLEGSLATSFIVPVIALFSSFGLIFSNFHTGAEDLHKPSKKLMQSERMIAELSQINKSAGMAVVSGGTLEEVLQREEQVFKTSVCLSKFLPSFKKRISNYEIIKDFSSQEGATLLKSIGFFELPHTLQPKEIKEKDIPPQIAQRFLFTDGSNSVMSIVPNVSIEDAKNITSATKGVSIYAPREMIASLINTHEKRAAHLLTLSFVLLFFLLGISYRKRVVLILTPSIFAVCSVFAFEQLTHGNVNFFHVLASFMIVGMALDYTIFLSSDFRGALKSVTCSFLTSLVGFGALSFVSFPIIRSFGTAFAVGLPVSYLVAWAIFKPKVDKTERASTPLGMEIAWMLYSIFGKGLFDFIARVVANVVWIFDPVARKASFSRQKMINFALSLADKIAVLSMGKGQPKIVFEENDDTRTFLEDIEKEKGAVVISSHLGNTEAIAAYGECKVKFHVFMSLSRTATFRAFKDRHSKRTMIEVHPTEGFGIAELFLGLSIVDEGGVVLIAGDRGNGRSKEYEFLGSKRSFPEGAFRFAKHLERNVYFVAALKEKDSYRVYVKRLPYENMAEVYVSELERLVKVYPDQWYQWHTKGKENG